MLAKKTSKNQVTLPKEIVKAFPDPSILTSASRIMRSV
jgi:hypothetical protein